MKAKGKSKKKIKPKTPKEKPQEESNLETFKKWLASKNMLPK